MKNNDILLSLSLVVLNCTSLFFPFSSPWLSIPLVLPLIFFVPGYMLTLALTHPRRLSLFYSLTFGIGLSLTLAILSGFLLNLLPGGLNGRSWVIWLSLVSLTLGLVTLYRRKSSLRTSERERKERTQLDKGQHALRSSSNTNALWPKIGNGAIYAFAALLVVCALIYATQDVAEGQQVGFTQLWLLPSGQHTTSCSMQVGIRSFENSIVTYQVAVTVEGDPTRFWSELTLSPHQLWLHTISLQPQTVKILLVEVQLYRVDKPDVIYREVHMTVAVVQNTHETLACVV